MKILYILPCTSGKIWKTGVTGPQQAKEAYTGALFKKGRELVESIGGEYLILSAKYGFIHPKELIFDYNITFKKVKPDIPKLRAQVSQMEFPNIVVVLGGSTYAKVVKQVFTNSKIILPLEGYKIGYMLQALGDHEMMVDLIKYCFQKEGGFSFEGTQISSII